jgi:hypothetical protein
MAAKDDRTPDKVTHSSEFVIGHKPSVEVTKIEKDGETTTGRGWDRDEADKNAGEKFSRGEKD